MSVLISTAGTMARPWVKCVTVYHDMWIQYRDYREQRIRNDTFSHMIIWFKCHEIDITPEIESLMHKAAYKAELKSVMVEAGNLKEYVFAP